MDFCIPIKVRWAIVYEKFEIPYNLFQQVL